MGAYEEGIKLIEEYFGKGKDITVALATVTRVGGKPQPLVREVDAYYEDGAFYVTTHAMSNKMRQIAECPAVSVAVTSEPRWFTAVGAGENLGWVMKPENAELRTKLRAAFAAWYDAANNEQDENCCILAVRLTEGVLNVNHWEKLYHLDFVNKTETRKE